MKNNFYKRAIGLLLVCSVLNGCQPKKNVQNTEPKHQTKTPVSEAKETPAPQATEIPTATPKQTEEHCMEKQIQLFADNRQIWMAEYMDDAYEPYSYTVTDLDRNGRLEVILSSCQGTGHFTYSHFYEVNEEINSLVECDWSVQEGDSEPDIIVNEVPVYLDRDKGVPYYIFSDYSQNGYAEQYEAVCALSIQCGVVRNNIIGRSSTIYQDENSFTQTFTNAEEEKVSKDEFKKLPSIFFVNADQFTVRFQWNEIQTREDVMKESDEELTEILMESYQVFQGK